MLLDEKIMYFFGSYRGEIHCPLASCRTIFFRATLIVMLQIEDWRKRTQGDAMTCSHSIFSSFRNVGCATFVEVAIGTCRRWRSRCRRLRCSSPSWNGVFSRTISWLFSADVLCFLLHRGECSYFTLVGFYLYFEHRWIGCGHLVLVHRLIFHDSHWSFSGRDLLRLSQCWICLSLVCRPPCLRRIQSVLFLFGTGQVN